MLMLQVADPEISRGASWGGERKRIKILMRSNLRAAGKRRRMQSRAMSL